MKGFGWKRKSTQLGSSAAFSEDNRHKVKIVFKLGSSMIFKPVI